MDVNLWTFSGSTTIALIAAFLSWGRGMKSCVVAAFVTVAFVVGVFAFRGAVCRATGLGTAV